jgi:hypothetical protein
MSPTWCADGEEGVRLYTATGECVQVRAQVPIVGVVIADPWL